MRKAVNIMFTAFSLRKTMSHTLTKKAALRSIEPARKRREADSDAYGECRGRPANAEHLRACRYELKCLIISGPAGMDSNV
jgi:hypothetical protein